MAVAEAGGVPVLLDLITTWLEAPFVTVSPSRLTPCNTRNRVAIAVADAAGVPDGMYRAHMAGKALVQLVDEDELAQQAVEAGGINVFVRMCEQDDR